MNSHVAAARLFSVPSAPSRADRGGFKRPKPGRSRRAPRKARARQRRDSRTWPKTVYGPDPRRRRAVGGGGSHGYHGLRRYLAYPR